MKTWLKKLFKKEPRVQVGDVWKMSKNPFNENGKIRVLDIKDEYVQYQFLNESEKTSISIEHFSKVFEALVSRLQKEKE